MILTKSFLYNLDFFEGGEVLGQLQLNWRWVAAFSFACNYVKLVNENLLYIAIPINAETLANLSSCLRP